MVVPNYSSWHEGRVFMKIISGNSNRPLAQSIASYLKVPLLQASIDRYADHEVCVEIHESVRGHDVFVIQSTSSPTNDTLMELLVIMDALKRSSARSITAVLPYYGYGRQDRKTSPRGPISAKLVANLLMVAGANRILTIDWHSSQIQGFFDIPTDNLSAAPLFSRHLKERYGQDSVVIVSPDVGGLVRARIIAEHFGVEMAIIDKRRTKPGNAEVLNIIGDVGGQVCILIDDMVDSAGTLCQAAHALKEAGAKDVDAYVSHGVLSGGALEIINQSRLRHLVISDTIRPTLETVQCPKIEIQSVSNLLGEAIYRIVNDLPILSLFEFEETEFKEAKNNKLVV
jgi:ribose-phosphate pyrophosphokinase